MRMAVNASETHSSDGSQQTIKPTNTSNSAAAQQRASTTSSRHRLARFPAARALAPGGTQTVLREAVRRRDDVGRVGRVGTPASALSMRVASSRTTSSWSKCQPPPDPATIAGEILASINLRAVDIGLAPKPGPTSASLIGLPVWMWVDDPSATTWGPESKSKTERGLTVTVTAAVDYVDWTMGDGTTVRCDQGTARPESDSVEPSPDCGHVYSTSSADQASGKFSITATSHWTVRWVAGALNGTLDPLELTSTGPTGDRRISCCAEQRMIMAPSWSFVRTI